jgi:ribosomal protein S6--L-glutamate ligase
MSNLLLINGEQYWPDYFPDAHVTRKTIQDSSWILKQGKLYVLDREGVCQPDGILWRVGAIKPTAIQTTALNLIELAGVPCVNSAATLKQGFDRLSMLAVLQQQGLPVIDFEVVTASTLLKNIKRDFPFVVKVGNYHGGYGKLLVRDEQQWQEAKDLLFISSDYVTIEPYIPYERDIRYLAVGDDVHAMARRGKYWKANVETTDFQVLELEAEWTQAIKALQQTLNADLLAIDILEEKDGKRHVVEYNDIPGLSGFSENLRWTLANCLKEKL